MRKKTVLMVDSGGRGHALGWKLQQSPHVGRVIYAPGNAGVPLTQRRAIAVTDIDALATLAEAEKVDLTVWGPELPLTKGAVDRFAARGLRSFGPTEAAAKIEGSKIFAKEVMRDAGIPTADYAVANTISDVERLTHRCVVGIPAVIKMDGLCAGKGVMVCKDKEDVQKAIDRIFVKREFGNQPLIVEECLKGQEISIGIVTDGVNYDWLPEARDYKRLLSDDQGPNTGGMGAYSRPGQLTPLVRNFICQRIVEPLLDELSQRGTPFCGHLYPGLMLTADGPKVLEFNCRFSDPETLVIMRRLRDDLFPLLWAASDEGGLCEWESVSVTTDAAVGIIAAAEGYAVLSDIRKGDVITGIPQAEFTGAVVFHAGTEVGAENKIVTAGGRILGVTALGKTLAEARNVAYDAMQRIHFRGIQYRPDIGA